MSEPPPVRAEVNELTSWKDIAAYLGVTVRTAQKWEQERGLPVSRVPGKRSIVTSRVVDLDTWRRTGETHPAPTPARSWLRWAWLPALSLAAGLAIVVIRLSGPPVTPTGWQIAGDTFIATGIGDRELWRYRFPHSLSIPAMRNPNLRSVQFMDLDGDGVNELLVSAHFADPREASDLLQCFSHTGQPLWQFIPGREMRTGKEVFAPPYHLASVMLLPLMPDGKRYLVATSHHGLYYPNQIAVIDYTGKPVYEYWHSGQLRTMAFADLDRDGEPEIYLGGVSNGHRCATLIGLKMKDVQGASVESNPDYQLLGLPPAHETLRILFARSDLSSASVPFNDVTDIAPADSGIAAHVQEQLGMGSALVHYHFDSNYSLADVSAGDYFPVEHDALFRQGRLDHRFERLRDIEPLRNITYLRRP